MCPSPSPSASSPTLREKKGGDYVPRLPPGPLPLPRCGRGAGGEGSPSPSPSAPTRWERRGDARSRGDPAAVQITPLPQRGRGAGGEGYPQRGRGARGEGSPSPSPSSSTRWERRGEERSRGDPAAVQITPLPQRGRGAGGEDYPQRGRGAGGEGYPYIISLRR